MKKLAIIIPVYNEEKSIRGVILSIPKIFNLIEQTLIIVVDDGSTDQTLEKIKDLDVIAIRHKKNLGVGRSFQDGLEKALELKADYLINIDGDGQFNPKDIEKLLVPLQKGRADFVTASRFIDKSIIPKMPKIKLWGNKIMSKIVSLLLKERYYDVSCGFRGYNQEAMLRLNLFGDFTYTQETFLDLGFKGLKILEVPIEVQYFSGRQSKVAASLVSYSWRTLKIIIRTVRDYRPLKFFGGFGFLIFLFGLALDIILLIYYFVAGSFSPYKIIGFTGAFLNILGIIIVVLGLVADMLYRIRLNQEEILYRLKRYRSK